MTQKYFFLKNINLGNHKTQNFMLISNSWMPTYAPKKAIAKNLFEFWVFSFLRIFSWFLTFIRGLFEGRHQRIWNQHQILRFFYTHIDISKEKLVWVIIALFANFNCKCEKTVHFQTFFKLKFFFANIYHSPFDSYLNSKKSINWSPLCSHHAPPSFLGLSNIAHFPWTISLAALPSPSLTVKTQLSVLFLKRGPLPWYPSSSLPCPPPHFLDYKMMSQTLSIPWLQNIALLFWTSISILPLPSLT